MYFSEEAVPCVGELTKTNLRTALLSFAEICGRWYPRRGCCAGITSGVCRTGHSETQELQLGVSPTDPESKSWRRFQALQKGLQQLGL